MRTITRVKLIFAGLATLGAALSPQAHADPNTNYIVDLANAGVPMGTPAQEAYMGQLICQNLAGGLSAVNAAQRLLGAGVTVDQAAAIVGFAIVDLCPQYRSALPSTSTPSQPSTPTGDSQHVTIASSIA